MAWVNRGLNLQLYRPLEPEQPWLPAGACMLMKFWHPSASHRDMTHPWWAKAQTELLFQHGAASYAPFLVLTHMSRARA